FSSDSALARGSSGLLGAGLGGLPFDAGWPAVTPEGPASSKQDRTNQTGPPAIRSRRASITPSPSQRRSSPDSARARNPLLAGRVAGRQLCPPATRPLLILPLAELPPCPLPPRPIIDCPQPLQIRLRLLAVAQSVVELRQLEPRAAIPGTQPRRRFQ